MQCDPSWFAVCGAYHTVEKTVWVSKTCLYIVYSLEYWGEKLTESRTMWETRIQQTRGSDRVWRRTSELLQQQEWKKRGNDAPDWTESSSPQLMRSPLVMLTFTRKKKSDLVHFKWDRNICKSLCFQVAGISCFSTVCFVFFFFTIFIDKEANSTVLIFLLLLLFTHWRPPLSQKTEYWFCKALSQTSSLSLSPAELGHCCL